MLKCHQADKTKYMIAFDSSRIGSADGVAGGIPGRDYVENDYLTASLNHNSRQRHDQYGLLPPLDSSMTASMNGNTAAQQNGSSSNATFTTVTSSTTSSPESNLKFKSDLRDHARDQNIPIFELETGRRNQHYALSHSHSRPQHFSNSSSDFSSALTPETESDATSPSGKNFQDFSSDAEPVIPAHRSLKRQQPQAQPNLTSHSSHRQDGLSLQNACNHALDRLKIGASPIREEEEPSTDSSRADVQMKSHPDSNCFHHPSSGLRREGSGYGSSRISSDQRGSGNRSQFRTSQPYTSGYESHNTYESGHMNQYPVYQSVDHDFCRRRNVHSQRIRSAPQTPCSGYAPAFTPHGMSSCANNWVADKPQETLYVCYPNYSLPDLSFLNASANASSSAIPADANILLSPTKPIVRPAFPIPGSAAGAGGGSKANSGRKARPKSFDDIGNLSKSTIAAVKDWESLNFLLPDDVRQFLGVKGLSPVTETGQPFPAAAAADQNNPPRKLFSPSSTAAPPVVTMRRRLPPRDPIKRLSLQEPMVRKMGWQQQQQLPATGSRTLTRSETMQPQMHQPYNSSHFCGCVRSASNHCCHAAVCHTAAHATCCQPILSQCCHQKVTPDDSSIDTLCHLLNMQDAVTDVTDLLKDLKFDDDAKTGKHQKTEVHAVKSKAAKKQSPNKTKAKATGVTKAVIVKPVVPPKPKILNNNSNNDSGQLLKSPGTPFKSMIPISKSLKTPTKSSKRCV